jgi:hypothetical protein
LTGLYAMRLLDVGAWDSKTFSNSRALIELGWHAVLIEPSPRPLARLIEDYRENTRVKIIGSPVVTQTTPYYQMWLTDDGLSTGTIEEYDRWKNNARFYGQCFFAPIKLETILANFGPFEFVSLDTEGTSVELLKAYISKMKSGYEGPAAMCVEHNNRLEELREAIKGQFVIWHQNDTNVVLKAIQ